jgi:hypothetical protein
VVRWRRVDLAALIAARFGVVLAERTVGTLLRRLGFVRLSVRPRHPAHDAEAQAAPKKNFADLVAAAIPERARGNPIELWWQDGWTYTSNRVGQQGTLTRVWADKGSRPPAPRDQRFADPGWQLPPFRGLMAATLLAEEWWLEAVRAVPGVTPRHAQQMEFLMLLHK